MSQLNERGTRNERGSALRRAGGRNGDRTSVLWGKGGRGLLISMVAVVALAAPLAATAGPGKDKKPAPAPAVAPVAPVAPTEEPAPDASNGKDKRNWVDHGLLDKAKAHPNDRIDVIITSTGGTTGADKAYKWLDRIAAKSDNVGGGKTLDLVGGITASLPAKLVAKLQKIPGINVTPDAPVRLSAGPGGGPPAGGPNGLKSSQLWPYVTGNALQWADDKGKSKDKRPAIAIVDSGVQPRADFGTNIIASVNLSTIPGNTAADTGTTDQRGHGTFVAGIAAGSAPNLAGAAPGAPIVSVKVLNADGMAKTSDVIAACQWILANKAQYNIGVANFSLHSTYGTNSYRDPLDQAVEKLWFNGVVVVAAAGNYGSASGPSGVLYAPGNDPFVITVGALDIAGTLSSADDTVAPWSAYGYTEDGFFKPEIAAPGRYMVGPIPSDSTIAAQKPAAMVGSDQIQLSGTSFAAPIVAGTAADLLAKHPGWSPDKVKGALMATTRKVSKGNSQGAGLGQLTASRAVASHEASNPNLGLEKYVVQATDGSGPVFDAMSWASAVQANMSWNSMSWSDQSWSDQSWSDQSWSSMSWADMSWSSMSWADMSWADMSWADLSHEDAVAGDTLAGAAGYAASDMTAFDASIDPDTAIPVDGVDPAVALGVVDPTLTTPDPTVTTPDPTVTTTTPTVTTTDPTVTTTTPTVTTTDPTVTTTTPTTTTP